MSRRTNKVAEETKENEKVEEPSRNVKPKQGKGGSKKKVVRNDKRMEEFRGKQGEKTVQENREALFEKLFFGFKNVTEALKNLQIQQVTRTIIVPISTRSPGFIIRNLMAKFLQLGVIDQVGASQLAGALYRVTLLQIDLKLEEAMLLQHSRNLENESFEDVYVTGDQRRALELMGANFSPLVNYVSAIGYIKTASKCYLPRHPKCSIVNPLHVRYGTLRVVVESLTSMVDPDEVRRGFFSHCPFPNARWFVRGQNVRAENGDVLPERLYIENPDDIMPLRYSLNNLRDDISLIATHVEKIGRKYPKYISTGGIDWRGAGSLSLLISSGPAAVGCPSWPLTMNLSIPGIVGEYDDFWCPEIVSDPEAYMGVVYLLGEIHGELYVKAQCSAFRMKAAACREISLDFATVLHNLLN